tara:strand:+ start:369 stop:680 length:312 start_codon:yes stop_codon:yes gene_type:complete
MNAPAESVPVIQADRDAAACWFPYPLINDRFADERNSLAQAFARHRTNQVAELVEALQWAFDTLIELNPSNYDHDNVCEVNAAAVEVMLGLKPILASHKGEQP